MCGCIYNQLNILGIIYDNSGPLVALREIKRPAKYRGNGRLVNLETFSEFIIVSTCKCVNVTTLLNMYLFNKHPTCERFINTVKMKKGSRKKRKCIQVFWLILSYRGLRFSFLNSNRELFQTSLK